MDSGWTVGYSVAGAAVAAAVVATVVNVVITQSRPSPASHLPDEVQPGSYGYDVISADVITYS